MKLKILCLYDKVSEQACMFSICLDNEKEITSAVKFIGDSQRQVIDDTIKDYLDADDNKKSYLASVLDTMTNFKIYQIASVNNISIVSDIKELGGYSKQEFKQYIDEKIKEKEV